ncbi:MAG: GAF domain-containing sensor histidine kinase [Ignavibacteriales bacterium]|nr:GAF domain-containing sensor histidine kinase [Ignavibacteriales bacterium]
MISAPIPFNEISRLSSLHDYNILYSGNETNYDEIVELASFICDTPIAYISLIDSEKQWFKAKVGIDITETPREIAFCAHAILKDDILVINDTLTDKRFADNPLVTSDPNIRFYAGAQLTTEDGFNIGTLCAVDKKPRKLTEDQLKSLKFLAKQVIRNFELRKLNSNLTKQSDELKEQNVIKDNLLKVISHDLRAPFNSILGFTELLKENINHLSKNEIKLISNSIAETSENSYELVNNLLNWAVLNQNDEKEKSIIDLQEMLKQIISVLNGLSTKKSISINTIFNDTISVKSNYDMLYSILLNLISNSIKNTHNNGEINIEIDSSTSEVQIKISDNGIGMSNKQIDKLLNANNFQINSDQKGENVTGVGFSLVKNFLQKINGNLKIDSIIGLGTTIIINLPNN